MGVGQSCLTVKKEHGMHEFFVDDEKKIYNEIREWSKTLLEENNPDFNGLPACPYAKAAWAAQRVSVIFKRDPANYHDLWSVISTWDDKVDLVIIVDLAFPEDSEAFHEYLDDINQAISDGMFIDRDIWVMGFHPDQEPNELVDNGSFEPVTAEEYAMIFIQRLSKLEESADKIRKLGYYDRYFDAYDVENMYKVRHEFYRRLISG